MLTSGSDGNVGVEVQPNLVNEHERLQLLRNGMCQARKRLDALACIMCGPFPSRECLDVPQEEIQGAGLVAQVSGTLGSCFEILNEICDDITKLEGVITG